MGKTEIKKQNRVTGNIRQFHLSVHIPLTVASNNPYGPLYVSQKMRDSLLRANAF